MLKRIMMAWLACAGCAAEEADHEVLDRLPALALSEGVVAGLPECGDTIPHEDDVVARLGRQDSDTIVVLRNGQPYCAEALRTWLGVEVVSDPESESESESEEDEGDDGRCTARTEDDKSPYEIAGPRPIPWMDGDDDEDDK